MSIGSILQEKLTLSCRLPNTSFKIYVADFASQVVSVMSKHLES